MFLKYISFFSNKNKYSLKILLLLLNAFVFSIIYTFLDSSNFAGLNPLQDKIKDNIVEKEVNNDEPFTESFQESYNFTELFGNIDKDKAELTEDVKNVVKDEEDKIERPSLLQRYFDMFYFSTLIACLLGSGNIHPSTNIVKLLVCCQSFITLSLILY